MLSEAYLLGAMTLSIAILHVTTLSITKKQNATLSMMIECCYAVSFMLTVGYAELSKYALNADCHYAECRGAF
jgi:hypothetical protein